MNVNRRVLKAARRKGLKVYTRRQWGNISPVYQIRRRTRKHSRIHSDTLWQHISVTHRTNIKADMRTLHRIGMERFGSGVSYNFGIDHITGEIGVGQALDAKGTHTIVWRKDLLAGNWSKDQNAVAHAFCFIGMPGSKPTDKAIRSAGLLMAAMVEAGALTKGHDYKPHSFAVAGTPFAKSCPTPEIIERMGRIHQIAMDELD
jgi:hypothetical protein